MDPGYRQGHWRSFPCLSLIPVGYSDATFTHTTNNTALFSGTLSTRLPAASSLDIRHCGYAAIKTKDPRATLFGTTYLDTSPFRYLWIRVKGHVNTRASYFVNIQTAGVVQTDVFQHRLWLKRVGEWETVLIPFREFVCTNNGQRVSEQVSLFRERVRSIGFSVLMRDERVLQRETRKAYADIVWPELTQPSETIEECAFGLELDEIKLFNTFHTDGDLDLNLE